MDWGFLFKGALLLCCPLCASSCPSGALPAQAQDDARFLLSADTLFETVQPSEVRCRALQVDV